MKKLLLIPAVALVLLGLGFGIFAFCGYHARPELVKEIV